MIYYHYTSISAFYQIVTNKTFWLTSLRSSNDSQELFYDIEQFKTDLSKVIADEKDLEFRNWLTGVQKGIKDKNQEFHRFCKPPKKGDVFGLSLCSIRDNLTHWDRYADRCEGVCIGIDDSFILRSLKGKRMNYFGGTLVNINDVIYEDDIKEALRSLFKAFYCDREDPEVMDTIYRNNPHILAVSVYTKLARFAKSQSFIDEHETRIFHDNADIKDTQTVIRNTLRDHKNLFDFVDSKYNEILDSLQLREIQYYVSPNRGIRSYKELCLADVWDEATIPEIIIGPMCPQSKDELKAFLKANGLKKTKVYQSKVSIR